MPRRPWPCSHPNPERAGKHPCRTCWHVQIRRNKRRRYARSGLVLGPERARVVKETLDGLGRDQREVPLVEGDFFRVNVGLPNE